MGSFLFIVLCTWQCAGVLPAQVTAVLFSVCHAVDIHDKRKCLLDSLYKSKFTGKQDDCTAHLTTDRCQSN
jgi:hypothetical protein